MTPPERTQVNLAPGTNTWPCENHVVDAPPGGSARTYICIGNLYLYFGTAINIIGPCTHVRDLGVPMSSNCTFDFHISNLYKRCSNLADWILRTFTIRDPQVMLILYKSLVMSRLEYISQLWSPYLLKHVYLIEKVHGAFTKHISGMCFLFYSKRLEVLKLYSLQRRREIYSIIYVWKIIEGLKMRYGLLC